MLLPVIAILFGAAGLVVCAALFLRCGKRPVPVVVIRETRLNREINLQAYWPTPAPSIFVERNLLTHPFRVQKNGVFCGDCLFVNSLRAERNAMSMHQHACTVSSKDWKILVCADGIESDYYISLNRYHFRNR